MKTKLMAVVAAAAAMFTGALRADVETYTEKVDGLTWYYQIENGKAKIYRELGGHPHEAVGDR